MDTPERKLVFAPFGADMFGDDLLLFEHGILFALETVVEYAGGFAYADIHAQAGGADKKDAPMPPLTEPELRTLATRAGCDAFIDGMLSSERSRDTAALTGVTVALRLFFPPQGRFDAPEALTFSAFDPAGRPDKLTLDYDLYIALQYRLCERLLYALGVNVPPGFTTEALQITPSWEAYLNFLKGKRLASSPETKLGYYNQAAQHDPKFFLALYNSAMLYKTQTDYQTARSRLSRAASATNDPTLLADVYFELGLCSIYLGDPKTARNFWEQALEFGADNPTLYVNMAGTYEQEENLADAIRLNELALDRFPEYHKAIVNLGRLYAMRGNLDKAIPLYQRAVEMQPDDALRHSVLGGCLLAAGQDDEARLHFARAMELDPEGDPGRYARQEWEKLGPPADKSDPEPRKKRWGLW